MKKIIPFLLTALIVKVNVTASPKVFFITQPRATFEKMWVDYDIKENGAKGMRLHVKFTAHDMLNTDAYLAVYFMDENGKTLKDKNNKYNSTAGDVAVYKSIKPAYNPAVYDDLQIFMPYEELDMAPGNYTLTMDVKLIYKAGGVIQELTEYDFEYTEPETTYTGTSTSSGPDASFEKLWIDYDVTENGKKGMRIHVSFSVFNMKGRDCYLAVYFMKKNGDVVRGNNSQYRSTDGQAAVYKSLKPAYNDAVYNDTRLFMPYSEFDLPSGKIDLKLDADIIYKDGGIIKHLEYKEFWFKR